MNPWDDDTGAERGGRDARPGAGPKPPAFRWGCAIAAIIGSVTVIVVAVIALRLIASLVDIGELTP